MYLYIAYRVDEMNDWPRSPNLRLGPDFLGVECADKPPYIARASTSQWGKNHHEKILLKERSLKASVSK